MEKQTSPSSKLTGFIQKAQCWCVQRMFWYTIINQSTHLSSQWHYQQWQQLSWNWSKLDTDGDIERKESSIYQVLLCKKKWKQPREDMQPCISVWCHTNVRHIYRQWTTDSLSRCHIYVARVKIIPYITCTVAGGWLKHPIITLLYIQVCIYIELYNILMHVCIQ